MLCYNKNDFRINTQIFNSEVINVYVNESNLISFQVEASDDRRRLVP
jgi:hypothetical protein